MLEVDLRMIRNVIMFLMFFCSHDIYAGTLINDLTIKEMSMGWAGEGVFVWVNESITVVEGCSDPVFTLKKETALFEENYSMLLSAFHSGSKVGLYSAGCYGNNMELKAVRIKK